MGREIRRVPKDWEHPTETRLDTLRGGMRTDFKPLHGEDYETVAAKWWADAEAWHSKNLDYFDEDYNKEACAEGDPKWFWEWDGGPPDPEAYRPMWSKDEQTHFQIYETVSEGTPRSPVFETLEQLVEWMCKPIDRVHWSQYNRGEDWQCMQGRSRESAEAFAKSQHTFSCAFLSGRGFVDGVEANRIMSEGD